MRFIQRAWFRIWAAMVVLSLLLVAVDMATGNDATTPGALFYAAAAGPLAFAVATHVRTRFALDVAPGTLLGMFLFGGGLALTLGAFFDALFTTDPGLWTVGFIEELAKFLPVLVVALTGRYLWKRAGLALGFATAMGFAIFETMFYGFDELARDGIVGAEFLEVYRSLLTPFVHLAWTGLLCAVAFGIWQQRGKVVTTPMVIGAYLLVAVLHSANDVVPEFRATIGPIAFLLSVVIALTSYVLFRLSTRDLTLPPDDAQPSVESHLRAEIPEPRSAESGERASPPGTATGGRRAGPRLWADPGSRPSRPESS
jgi:RsiW-degrading membrane proteinase PrsW (M82 family)